MRVVVYNLKGFRLGRGPIAQVLRDLAPDLVLIQESGPRRHLRALARELGMAAASDPWSPFRRRVKNAVLVREPMWIVSSRLHRFPGTELLHPRGVLVAEVDTPQGRVAASSGHFGLVPAERASHAERLVDLVLRTRGPILLGIDLNEPPTGSAARRVSSALIDGWAVAASGSGDGATFPADGPAQRIDYLFASDRVQVRSARVAVEAGIASDHLPVVADVVVEDGI